MTGDTLTARPGDARRQSEAPFNHLSNPLAFLYLAINLLPVTSYQTDVDNTMLVCSHIKVTILDTVQSINFGIYFLADESIRLINANRSQQFTLIEYNNELDMR